jgi:hypothetical protein
LTATPTLTVVPPLAWPAGSGTTNFSAASAAFRFTGRRGATGLHALGNALRRAHGVAAEVPQHLVAHAILQAVDLGAQDIAQLGAGEPLVGAALGDAGAFSGAGVGEAARARQAIGPLRRGERRDLNDR